MCCEGAGKRNMSAGFLLAVGEEHYATVVVMFDSYVVF